MLLLKMQVKIMRTEQKCLFPITNCRLFKEIARMTSFVNLVITKRFSEIIPDIEINLNVSLR